MFRALTVSSECGAGGGLVAELIAESLGWTLLDDALVDSVARVAQVDRETAAQYDEQVDSWWHRAYRGGVWAAAIEGGMSVTDATYFDGGRVAALTERAILDAACKGNCVIVGRGAQCILQHREDVFHAFVYGPSWERAAAVGLRKGCRGDAAERVRLADEKRAQFVRTYYGCDWKDPHLYHMMLSSRIGVANVAWMILDAVQRGEAPARVTAA